MDGGEDCPHRQQLEDSLLQCQTQKEILQVTRDNYLSIIDEFKRDLEELTVQVEQQQQQHQERQIPRDSPCEEPTHSALEQQNQRLIGEINSLKDTLCNRDHQIRQLDNTISRLNDCHENSQLKNEIYDLKQRNCLQSRIVLKTTDQLKEQEEQYAALFDNYTKLSQKFDVQHKDLKQANSRLLELQDKFCQVEKQQKELRMERNILREELISLKEKDAKRNGQERALCDQLKRSRLENEQSRGLIRNMQEHLKQEEAHRSDTVRKLEYANEDIRQQMGNITEECKQLQRKLKQQTDVNNQQQQIVVLFSKWKNAQVRSDEALRQCVKSGEDHMNKLLDENQNLMDSYNKLFHDYCLLESEMQTVRKTVNRRASSQMSPQQQQQNSNHVVGNDMAKCVRNLSNTSRRIAYLTGLAPMERRATGGEQQQQGQKKRADSTASGPSRTGATQFLDTLPIAPE